MLTKIIQKASAALAVVSAVATMIIMLLTIIDVFSRLSGGGSIPGLLELSEVSLVFLVFCGIAYGQQKRIHVAVSLLTARLPIAAGKAAVSAGIIVLLFILGWATYATGMQAIESVMRGEVRFGITKVPIWPARIMIPIGFGLLFCEFVIQLLAVIRGEEVIRGEVPPEEEIGA